MRHHAITRAGLSARMNSSLVLLLVVVLSACGQGQNVIDDQDLIPDTQSNSSNSTDINLVSVSTMDSEILTSTGALASAAGSVDIGSNSPELGAATASESEIGSNQSAISTQTLPEQPHNSFTTNTSDDLPMAGIFYGSPKAGGFGGSNTRVANHQSIRFRASRTGTINSVSWQNRYITDQTRDNRCDVAMQQNDPESHRHYIYCQGIDAGLSGSQMAFTLGNPYAVGSGGRLLVSIYPSKADGTPDLSAPPLGFSSTPFVPIDHKADVFHWVDLDQHADLVGGLFYHIVLNNLKPPPKLFRVSLEELLTYPDDVGAIGLNGTEYHDQPNQSEQQGPWLDGHATLWTDDVPLTADSEWRENSQKVGWWMVKYADDDIIGDIWPAFDGSNNSNGIGVKNIGGSIRARQNFIVRDADRRVDGVWLNYGHWYLGSNGRDMTGTLKNGNGQTITTVTFPHDAAIAAINESFDPEQGATSGDRERAFARSWHFVELDSPVDLIEGAQYYFELSAPSGAGFAVFAPPYGNRAIKTTNYTWEDAQAQYSENNGNTWTDWNETYEQRDLPLLFTIEGQPRKLP